MAQPMGIPPYQASPTPFGRLLSLASRWMAYSGGLLFIVLIIMSLISIIGRKLGFGPVNGDIELMQAGAAAATAAFLPYCTLLGEHLKVDFFTENIRPQSKRCLDFIAELLLTLMALSLTWRSWLQVFDSYDSGEVTPLVSLPIWIPMLVMIPGLALMAINALYRAWCLLVAPARMLNYAATAHSKEK
ncbi:MAG: TRAP transporter small permease [Enterobacteriaceae bacterium]